MIDNFVHLILHLEKQKKNQKQGFILGQCHQGKDLELNKGNVFFT